MARKIKEKNYKKRAIILLIVSFSLALILGLLLILRTDQSIAERFASTISRWWITISSRITSIFPFSIYETFLYVAVIAVVTTIVFAIVFFCKKQAGRAVSLLLGILVFGLCFGNVYTLSAGFAYYRESPDLPYGEVEYLSEDEKEELFAVAEFMMNDFAELAEKMKRDEKGVTVSPYSFDELNELLIEEYKRLDSPYFNDFTPKAKKIASKNIMSNMRMTGVFFAPFGEANVNPLTPPLEMPVTMAHEMAHAKGVMRENEANLVAYWLTLTSDDDYLRYSGYNACYSSLLQIVSYFDIKKSSEIGSKLSALVINEHRANNEFWLKYDLFEKITDAFYDFYLKLQGQKEGMNSYDEPLKDPGEIVTPKPDGGETVKPVYFMNNEQRMMFEAIKNRMEESGKS